jgi:hypothetical protein
LKKVNVLVIPARNPKSAKGGNIASQGVLKPTLLESAEGIAKFDQALLWFAQGKQPSYG